MSTHLQPQPHSHLLSLPTELRLQIWELLLLHHVHILKTLLQTSPTHRPIASLLRTSKQIYAETLPILYGENTFLAHPTLLTTLPAFLLSKTGSHRPLTLPPITAPRLLPLIRKFYIHVRLDTDPRFSKLQATESFTGVQELEVEVFQAMYGSCDFEVLRLFEGVRGVGRCVVWGSVGDGRYAAWLAKSMMKSVGEEVEGFKEEFVGGDRGWHAWAQGNR
ncbi:hypothetical protein M409DRAFT_59534 [Zasmidium cellare ATCC 36951]|uniref:DUF7730 domain-containing protein n=1 Tax=Zasmidium cellare ATCC 36951 TaxID=1080233 RepID=A0A6A6C1T2_ZASCE|nr:uncharacterized protein M409DRAFT_59534 [Zasmidium cellare ATCC 36951]KAF2161014.1 hypothetical protein M409DRAFT_59534 [Zasmidium cellare ATCC 36951]